VNHSTLDAEAGGAMCARAGPAPYLQEKEAGGVERLCGGKMNGCDRLGHGVDLCWIFLFWFFKKFKK
jgi:hypothetical protein